MSWSRVCANWLCIKWEHGLVVDFTSNFVHVLTSNYNGFILHRFILAIYSYLRLNFALALMKFESKGFNVDDKEEAFSDWLIALAPPGSSVLQQISLFAQSEKKASHAFRWQNLLQSVNQHPNLISLVSWDSLESKRRYNAGAVAVLTWPGGQPTRVRRYSHLSNRNWNRQSERMKCYVASLFFHVPSPTLPLVNLPRQPSQRSQCWYKYLRGYRATAKLLDHSVTDPPLAVQVDLENRPVCEINSEQENLPTIGRFWYTDLLRQVH